MERKYPNEKGLALLEAIAASVRHTLRNCSRDALESAKLAASECDRTNCAWYVYDLRDGLLELIEDEQRDRQRHPRASPDQEGGEG